MTILLIAAVWLAVSIVAGLLIGRWLRVCSRGLIDAAPATDSDSA